MNRLKIEKLRDIIADALDDELIEIYADDDTVEAYFQTLTAGVLSGIEYEVDRYGDDLIDWFCEGDGFARAKLVVTLSTEEGQ